MSPRDPCVWRFGAATADITPTGPVLLTGYMRDDPSSLVRNPIHSKVAYLQDSEGREAVIANADLIGFSRPLIAQLTQEIAARFGIARENLILNASHNHSGPAVEGVLPIFHPFTAETAAATTRYTAFFCEALLNAIGEARAAAEPCRLDSHSGMAGLGTNRRRAAAHLRHLPTVVDQDVPVLVARNEQDRIRGILFGYACHTTVMFDNFIDGDYSGYAQRALEEEYPGCTAIFLAGCGGDINPMPRRRVSLSQSYGNILSTAVLDAIASERIRIDQSRIRGAFQELSLGLEPAPPIAEIEKALDETTLRDQVIASQFRPMPPEWSPEETEKQIQRTMDGVRRKLRYQLDCENLGTRATEVPYPIQVLELGSALTLVALAGEPVADYALRIKERYGFLSTWPMGYCNELTAYIPSHRVLSEGGYEGKTSMMEYGLPSPFREGLETQILNGVDTLIEEVRNPDLSQNPAERMQPAAA